MNYVLDYIQKREHPDREGIAGGGVWVRDGKASFRLKEFKEYLKRQSFREVEGTALYTALRGLGLTVDNLTIKGVQGNVWTLNIEGKVQDEPFEPVTYNDSFGDDNAKEPK